MEMFSFIFNDSIVKTSPLLYFSTLYEVHVLNRKQEIENLLSKKNVNSFVFVLVNCFSPNTSDKTTFIK